MFDKYELLIVNQIIIPQLGLAKGWVLESVFKQRYVSNNHNQQQYDKQMSICCTM